MISYKKNKNKKIIISEIGISYAHYVFFKYVTEIIYWQDIIDIDYGYKYTRINSKTNEIWIDSSEYDDYYKIKEMIKLYDKKR